MGFFILIFLWRELEIPRLRYYIIAALSLYAFAVGLDFVEGLDQGPYPAIAEYFATKVATIGHLSKDIEEFMEMLGTTFFLITFLHKLFLLAPKWNLEVQDVS